MVVRTRQLWNKTTHQVQFYLTSYRVMRQLWRVLSACIGALKINCTGRWMSLLQKMRLGCVLVMHRKNLALLRRIALNSLNRELSFKRMQQKSNRAAMDNDYM